MTRPRSQHPTPSPFSFSFRRFSRLMALPLVLILTLTLFQGVSCGCGSPLEDLEIALKNKGGDPLAQLGVLMAFYRDSHPALRWYALERAMLLGPEGRQWALQSLERALKKKDILTLSRFFGGLSNSQALSVWTALETLKLLQEGKGLDEKTETILDQRRTIQKAILGSETSLIPPFERAKLFLLLDHPKKNQTQIRTLLDFLSLKRGSLDPSERAFVELCAQSQAPLLATLAKVLL